MILRDMRDYPYTMLGAVDDYGQMTLDGGATGTIRMAVYVASQNIGDSILYREAQYVGMTKDDVTDRHVIHYNGEKLKVLYVQPKGVFKQVFMAVTA